MKKFGHPGVLLSFVVVACLLIFYPHVINGLELGQFWTTLGLQICIWITLAVSWNFFSGYTGYSSFGHGAFYGIGMYTTSTLMTRFDIPFLLTLPFAGLMAGAVALSIGAVVFRQRQFRGELFSLLTLAITFIVTTIVLNIDFIDGGFGVLLRDVGSTAIGSASTMGIYYTALAIALFTTYLAYYIAQSRWGQALFAIRDDEDVADGLGVSTYQYKMWTFALSSFCVGMIGSTQAIFLGYLEATSVFSVVTPLLALMMAIFGGSSVWYGPIIGAVIITSLRQLLTGGDTAVINQIIIGLVLILVILFMPEGIAGRLQKTFQSGKKVKPAAIVETPG